MQRSVRQAPEGQRSGLREAYLRDGRREYQAAVGARTNSSLQIATAENAVQRDEAQPRGYLSVLT